MYLMRTAAWISGDHYGSFFYVNALLLTVFAVGTAVGLWMLAGRRALWFALAPTLLIYGTINWDLFAVMLMVLALVAFAERRDGWAGALLGLGAAAKFFPALLLLPLFLQATAGSRARPLGPGAVVDGRLVGGRQPAVRDRRARARGGSSSGSTANGPRTSTASGTSPAVTRARRASRPERRRRCRSGCSSRLFGAAVPVEAAPGPRLPAMDARLPAARELPAGEQGLLAAVRALAPAVVRARRPRSAPVRRVRDRGRRGVRHAVLVLRRVHRRDDVAAAVVVRNGGARARRSC